MLFNYFGSFRISFIKLFMGNQMHNLFLEII